MSKPLFDLALRAARRDRAFRHGPALFLHDRIFADILERISLVRRQFSTVLLIGCPNPEWPARLSGLFRRVSVVDPGPAFARAAGGATLNEDEERLGDQQYDLCIAIGTLDTANHLPLALANIRAALVPDAMLIGAMSGGNSLPRLRSAMSEADQVMGGASPRIHPRIDGPGLCELLSSVGFAMPVVDVDKIAISYTSLRRLVADLRAMGATNILADRSRVPLTRRAIAASEASFNSFGDAGRTQEIIEILHFAAWTPHAQ